MVFESDARRHEAGVKEEAQRRATQKTAMHAGERKGMSTMLSRIMKSAAARVRREAKGKRNKKEE